MAKSSPDLQLKALINNRAKAAGVLPQLMLRNYKLGRRSTLSEHQEPDPHAIRTSRALSYRF